MRSYLLATGFDGHRGDLTDPIDCADLAVDSLDAEFCVIDAASVYAPGLVILFVADADAQEDVWEVHIDHTNEGWQVGEIEAIPAE